MGVSRDARRLGTGIHFHQEGYTMYYREKQPVCAHEGEDAIHLPPFFLQDDSH